VVSVPPLRYTETMSDTDETTTDETTEPEADKPGTGETGPPPRLVRSRKSDQAARPGFRDPANLKSKAMKKSRKKKRK
jgi:hypothetical protein